MIDGDWLVLVRQWKFRFVFVLFLLDVSSSFKLLQGWHVHPTKTQTKDRDGERGEREKWQATTTTQSHKSSREWKRMTAQRGRQYGTRVCTVVEQSSSQRACCCCLIDERRFTVTTSDIIDDTIRNGLEDEQGASPCKLSFTVSQQLPFAVSSKVVVARSSWTNNSLEGDSSVENKRGVLLL